MSNFKLMPDPLDLREVTFSNLLLLGFNLEANEAQYRIPFNRDMFSVPNRKAMEVVIHFLFTKLNHDSAKETFRNCWPIMDKKKEQEFRKLTMEWLNKIKKEDPNCHITSVVPSLLLSPMGDKFYQFLFYFSTYVLKQKMHSLPSRYSTIPSWPIISSASKKYLPQLSRGLVVSTINQQSRLVSQLEEAAYIKESWMELTKEVSQEHRKLNKKRREIEKKLKELKDTMQQVLGRSTMSSKKSLRRTQQMQKVTEFWKTISTLYESQKLLQEEIQHLVNGTFAKKSLDGDNIDVKIPDILLRECEEQLYKGHKYHNIYEGGKINLTSLIQLWNLSLHLIKEMLSQYPLPDLEHDEAYLRAEAHNHANSLNNVTSMRSSLSKQLLPDINLSIEELKETILGRSTVKTPGVNKFGLDLLPATPPTLFDTQDTALQQDTPGQLFQARNHVPTPDAVTTLLNKIKNDSKLNDDGTPTRHFPGNKLSSSIKKSSKPVNQAKMTITSMGLKQQSYQQSHQSRIPISKNKQDTKTLAEKKRNDTLSKESSFINKANNTSKDKKVIKDTYIEEWCKNNKEVKNDFVKAQELLIDQIAQSVLNADAAMVSRSSTDEEDYKLHNYENREENREDFHALDNPLEAFSAEAFAPRDKVFRTPLKTEMEEDECCGDSASLTENHVTQDTDIDSLKQRLAHLNIGADKSIESSDDKKFDLSALQEKINTIKLRGLQNERSTTLKMDEFTTPKQIIYRTEITTPHERFVSPLHEPTARYTPKENDVTPITPNLNKFDSQTLNFVTPLHDFGYSDANLEKSSSPDTPTNRSLQEDTYNYSYDRDKTPVPFIMENTNKSSEELLQFTPAQKIEAIRKQKVDLFLENNKHLLEKTPKYKTKQEIDNLAQQSDSLPGNLLEYTPISTRNDDFDSSLPALRIDNNLLHTPMCIPSDHLINFITPFKDPFTPGENSFETRQDKISRDKLNMTSEEVDEFIEEVLSKTPALPSVSNENEFNLLKTPGMFSTNTPTFLNDYSLITPGKGLAEKLLYDDDDNDDEL